MASWKTELIVPERKYRLVQIENEIGISRSALRGWIERGWLVPSGYDPETGAAIILGQTLIDCAKVSGE